MRETVIQHLNALFTMHRELAESLPDDAFGQKLSVPSNTIGGQFFCLVGTRESFARALEGGAWAGWGCSMTPAETIDKQAVLQKLDASAG